MRLLIPLLLLALVSCGAGEPGVKESPVRLRDKMLTEASGLAVSRHNPKRLWVINDSGSKARVHRFTCKGNSHGSMKLQNVENTDWEDLAAFTLNGKPYLLIADTGDNDAKRGIVQVYIVAEPKLAKKDTLDIEIKPEWTIRFRYEDGPRDCEGVAVDAESGSILLITKREKKPAIYHLPLRKTSSEQVLTAKRLGLLAKLELPPKAKWHPYSGQPTAFDISSDGKTAAALSYRGAYLFRRSAKESWAKALARPPEILGAHGLSQAEALAFSPDGRTLHVTSEGKNPRLVSMPIPPAKP